MDFDDTTPSLFLSLDTSGIQGAPAPLRQQIRQKMDSFLEKTTSLHSHGQSSGHSSGVSSGPALASSAVQTLLPRFMSLKGAVLHELKSNVNKLLSLNPSRREGVARYLDFLTGQSSSMELVHWVNSPKTDAQKIALDIYFEEVALFILGQVLVLKSWSDRKIRPWVESDLGRLNWILSAALKPHLPLDRDGWQITKPNLYSWFVLTPMLQQEIFSVIQTWELSQEGTGFLESLINSLWSSLGNTIPQGHLPSYDPRFLSAVWENLHPPDEAGPDSPIKNFYSQKKNQFGFSPTLRDGGVARSFPSFLNWVGFEETPFLLFKAELLLLWWGPVAPPLWGVGVGLEALNRDQLQFNLGSPKPSLLSKIAEIEACEYAFVVEEKCRRSQNKSQNKIIEELGPQFKKLKASHTSLGTLQACVSLSKLRPGGLMFWAREEILSELEGTEALRFLLERGKLLAEWNFSEVEHSLPPGPHGFSQQKLFPKFFYVFEREADFEKRLNHRPLRITLSGHVRSHIELPGFFQDALGALRATHHPRGVWQITRLTSPSTQKAWADKWPDPACALTLKALDKLRAISLPLAAGTTIRHALVRGNTQKGLSLSARLIQGKRKLEVKPLFNQTPSFPKEPEAEFLVLFNQPEWQAPLQAYFESSIVYDWLEQNATHKADLWILTEQLLRFLPVPKSLWQALGAPCAGLAKSVDLGASWEKLFLQIEREPQLLLKAMKTLPFDEEASLIRSRALVLATTLRGKNSD